MKFESCSKCLVIAVIVNLILLSLCLGDSTSERYSELLEEALRKAAVHGGWDLCTVDPEGSLPDGPPKFLPWVEGLDDTNAVPFLLDVIYEGPPWDANLWPYTNPRFRHAARNYALLSLAASHDRAAFDILTDILNSDDNSVNWDLSAGYQRALLQEDIRMYAVVGLGMLADPNATDLLLRMFHDKNPSVKRQCLWSLAKIGELRAIEPMVEAAVADEKIDGLTLHLCIERMTKAKIQGKYLPKLRRTTYKDFPQLGELEGGTAQYKKMWQHWFRVRKAWTEQQFEKRYERWRKQPDASPNERQLLAVGINALPLMIGKVEEGETDLVPVISRLVDRQLPQDASQQQCLTWWQENKDKWLIPSEEERKQKK